MTPENHGSLGRWAGAARLSAPRWLVPASLLACAACQGEPPCPWESATEACDYGREQAGVLLGGSSANCEEPYSSTIALPSSCYQECIDQLAPCWVDEMISYCGDGYYVMDCLQSDAE
jgi:hypothetical protein